MEIARKGLRIGVSRRSFLKSAAATAGAVAGSALFSAAPAVAKETELHFLGWVGFVKEGDVEFDRQVQEWGKANRVKVKIEGVGGADLQTRMAAAVMTKAGPDLVHYQFNWAWLYGDRLADMSSVAEAASKEVGGFYPALVANTKVKGKARQDARAPASEMHSLPAAAGWREWRRWPQTAPGRMKLEDRGRASGWDLLTDLLASHEAHEGTRKMEKEVLRDSWCPSWITCREALWT